MAIFRPDTWDSNIWNSIVHSNEYSIHGDWPHYVIDVGGHIGSFSYFISTKKARRIVVIEPDPDNYNLLVINLRDQINNNIVVPIHGGIGASSNKLSLHSRINDNTGGMSYIESSDGPIDSYSLDDLLNILPKDNTPVLLKIDCEGCEYPALENCSQLHRINAIVGEFHVRGDKNQETIRNILESNGFIFSSHFTGSNNIGLFGAHRPK